MSRKPAERIAPGERSDYLARPVPIEEDEAVQHGIKVTYTRRGCRCERCRAWRRARDARRRANRRRRIEQGDPSIKHGLPSTYRDGCRCDACAARNAEHLKDWRRSNPGADSENARSWREEHPGHASADAARRQAETIPTATKHGQQWTGAELEIVVTRTDLTLVELAKMLGRTRIAVISARNRATHDPKWMQVAGVSDDDRRP